VPGEGSPALPPSHDGRGEGPSDNAPVQTDEPPGQGGTNPPATGPDGPLGERPGEDATTDTPGNRNGEDARRGWRGDEGRGGAGAPPDGVPAPAPPGDADQPGLGSSPVDREPDDGDPGNGEQPGPPSGRPSAPGQGASPLGRVQSSDRADARSPA
jgi:hypothetical protein